MRTIRAFLFLFLLLPLTAVAQNLYEITDENGVGRPNTNVDWRITMTRSATSSTPVDYSWRVVIPNHIVVVSPGNMACTNTSPGSVCTGSATNVQPGEVVGTRFEGGVFGPLSACLRQVNFTVEVTASDEIFATQLGPGFAVPADNAPELSLTALPPLPPATASPGDVLTYNLSARSFGDIRSNATLSFVVPPATSFVASGSSAWSCPDGAGPGTTCSILFSDFGGSESPTARLRVASSIPPGITDVTLDASISDSGCGALEADTSDNAVSFMSTLVGVSPDVAVSKAANVTEASPGDTILYTLSAANNGNQDETGVVLTETVPQGTVFTVSGSSPGWSCGNGAPTGTTCTLSLGAVAGGASTTATFAVTVLSPLPAGLTAITNVVVIRGDSGGGDPTDDTATVTTPLAPTVGPDVAVTKSADVTQALPGDVITYTLAAANNGNQDETGAVLTEIVPAATTFTASGSSPGWSCADGSPAGTTCTRSFGPIPGGSATFSTFAVTVLSPVPAGLTEIANGVSIRGDSGGGDPTDDSDTETTPLDPSIGPDVAITKSADLTQALPGDTITYTLRATNAGNQDETGVVLTETVPAGTTFTAGASSPGWSCADGSPAGTTCTHSIGALGGGASVSITFAVTVLSPLPAGLTEITNGVSIRGDSGDGDPTDDTDTDTTPIDPSAGPDVAIVKSANLTQALPGDTITYTLRATNAGNQDESGVVLTETVPAGTTFAASGSSPGWSCADDSPAATTCTRSIGHLGGGASITATFAVTVLSPLPAGLTEITNGVSIHGDSGDGDPADDTDTETTPLDPSVSPDVTITKSADVTQAAPGDVIIYTLQATNAGNQDEAGVVLTETVPVGTFFEASSSSPGWSCPEGSPAGTTCALSVGDLAAGGVEERSFAVRVADPLPAGITSFQNTVAVNGDNPRDDGDQDVEDTPVDPSAGPVLTVTKTADVAQVVPGGSVVYTITVQNTGNQDETGVVLTESVPEATFFDASGSSPGWSCPDAAPSGTMCLLTLGDLAAGTVEERTFAVRVADPLPAGVTAIRNSVSVDGDSDRDDGDDDGEDTPIDPSAGPALTVTKTADVTQVLPGGLIVYTITAANTGNQDETGVVVTETVPDATSFEASASSPGWACLDGAPAGTTCLLPLGDLAAGAVEERTFAVRVANPLPAGVASIRNSVAVNGDTDNDGDDDGEDTPIDPSGGPALGVTKTADLTQVSPGGSILYTITAENAGLQDETGVVLTEMVPAATSFQAAGSSPGWSCSDGSPSGTVCTLSLGDLAAGAMVTRTFAVLVTSPLPNGVTSIRNSVSIDGDNDQDDGDDDGEDTPVDPNGGPNLALTKTAAVPAATPGEALRYTLTVTNRGDQVAAGVRLEETVPGGTTFNAAASSPGWSCGDAAPAGTFCDLELGDLAPDAKEERTFTVHVLEDVALAAITNTVTAAAGNADPNTVTVRTPVEDVVVVRDAEIGLTTINDAVAGDLHGYALVVTNIGDAEVTELALESRVGPATAHDDLNPDWDCMPAPIEVDELLCTTQLVPLQPGQSLSFELWVELPVDAQSVLHVATLDAAPDDNPANNSAELEESIALSPRDSTAAIPALNGPGVLVLFLAFAVLITARQRRA